MSYSLENLKSKITSLQVRNHGTATTKASTTGGSTTTSIGDVTVDGFQSLASLQDSDAAEKRRLYTKHKRHLSMSRDKIIQTNKVKRPTSTPLVPLEAETSNEGVSSDAPNRTNKSGGVLLSAVRSRGRNSDLKLKIPGSRSSTLDASPCSTPDGGGATTPCGSPFTPGIAGAIALSRARSCSMVELFNQEGKQLKFQKSTFDVELLKKPGGKKLGFTVVGGVDTPGRPMGIYIKTIQPDSLAAEEGTLKQGDEILEVNGITFSGMTHQEAVSVFRKLKKGTVRINIRRFLPVAQTRKDSLDEGVSVTSIPMSPSCEGAPTWRHPLERRRSSDDVLKYTQHETEDNGSVIVEKKKVQTSKSENYSEPKQSTELSEPSNIPISVSDLPEKLENTEQVTVESSSRADRLANSSCLNEEMETEAMQEKLGAMETEKSSMKQENLKPAHQVEVENPGASNSASNGSSHQPDDVELELEWGPISDDISDLIQSTEPLDPLPLSPRKRGMPHGMRPRRPSTPRFMESQGSEDGSDTELETTVREFMSETSFVPIEKDSLPMEDVEGFHESPLPPVFETSSSLTTITELEKFPDERRITKEEPRALSSREAALSEYEDVFSDDTASESRTSSMTSFGDHVTSARMSTTPSRNLLPDSPEMINQASKLSQSDNTIMEMEVNDLQVQSSDSYSAPPSAQDQGLDPEEGMAFDQETMTTILEEPEEYSTTASDNNLLRQASSFVGKGPSNQDGVSISLDHDDISAGYHDNMTSSRVELVKADIENLTDDVSLSDALDETSGICHLEEDRQDAVMTELEINGENENTDLTEKSLNSESKRLELQDDLKPSETDDRKSDRGKKTKQDTIFNSDSSQFPVAASENTDFETQERFATQPLEFQDPSSERELLSDADSRVPDESSDRRSDSYLVEGSRHGISNSSSAEDDGPLVRPERFLELMLEPITPEATDTVSLSSTCTQLEPSRQEDPDESYHLPNISDSSLAEEYKAGLQVGDIPDDFQFKYSQNIESSCSNKVSVTRDISDDEKEGIIRNSNVEDDLQDFKKQRGRNSHNFIKQNDLDIRNHRDGKGLDVLPQEEAKDSENIDFNTFTSSDFFLTSEMIDISSPNHSKSEDSFPNILDDGDSENLSRETGVETTHPAGENQNISNVENADVLPDDATTLLTATDLNSNLDIDDTTLMKLDAGLISRETDNYPTSNPNRDCALSLEQKNGLADANHLKENPGYLNQENTITEEHRSSLSKYRSDSLTSFDAVPENRLQDSIDLKPFEPSLETDRNEIQLSSTMLSKGSYGNEDVSNVLNSHDAGSLSCVFLPPDKFESKSGANDIYENSPTVLETDHAKSMKHQFRITPDRQKSGTELSFFALDIKDDLLPQTCDISVDSENLDSVPPLPASRPPSVEDDTFPQTVDAVADKIPKILDTAGSLSTDFNDNEIVRSNDELLTSTVDDNGDSLLPLPHSERQELFTNCIRVSCDTRGLGGDISAEKNSTFGKKHGDEEKRGKVCQGAGAPPPPRQKLSIRFLQGSEGNIHWNVDRTEQRQIHSHSEERSSKRYQISSSQSKESLDLEGEDALMGTEGQNQDPNSVPIAILSWCSTNPSNGSSHPVSSVD